MKKLILSAGLLLAMLVPASAAIRGRVWVGYGYGWYGPGWGWWGPYAYYPYYSYAPNAGEVKIDTKAKDAEIYIDGSYAGTVKDLKTMYLRPGEYNFEVRYRGEPALQERIYVVAGKTIKLHPNIAAPTD